MLDGVSAFPKVLSPFVSHCTPSCFPLLDGVSALPRVLSPFVSHCTPSCSPLLDGLVSLCLPLYPSCFPLLDGTSAFPRDLSPFVSRCTLSCFPLLDSPFVYHCAPSCFPLLDGASGLLTSCLPLPPIVSHCLIVSPHVCLCWMVCPRSCLPFSPIEPIVSHCLPHTCACVGWCVRLFDALSFLFVSHCLATCVPLLDGVLSYLPVLDGVPAFPRSCLPLSLVSHVSAHVCLCLMVRPPSRRLVSPFCLPLSLPHVCACDGMSAWWHFRLPEVLSPLVSPCLPLSPHNIRLCWMVCPPSQGLVSPCIFHCLPPPFLFPFLGWCARLFKVLSPWSPRVPHCSPFSPIVSPHVCLFWMVCPPSPALLSPSLPIEPIVSHCLPLSAHTCACVGWRVRLFDVLSSLLSPHMCACVGWGLVLSACVGRCVRLLEVLSPLVSHMCACVGWCLSLGWCVRLPAVLSPRVCLCWMVCPPSRGLVSPCLPSPVLFPFVGWCVRLLDVLPLVSHLSPHMRACVRWFVRFPKVLSPLVFHCLPLSAQLPPIVSLLVSPSPVVSGCVSLFPIVSPHVCLCWMVCPSSEVLSPHCLPLFPRIGVPPIWIISAFKRPCLPMSPIVSPHVCLCWMLCPPSRGLVSFRLPLSPIVSPHVCLCWTVCPTSQGLVSPCLLLLPHMCACNVLCWMVRPPSRGFVSLLVSHCLPSCFPVLDGVSAFPRFCLPCLPACLWAGLPSCLPSLSPNLSVFLFPFVVGGLILHFFFNQCTVRGS